jgi:cytochrome c556
MIRYLSVAALLAVGATVAVAQGMSGDAAVKERQAAMKAISGANKGLTQMSKGDAPFDAAKASAALTTIAANAEKAKGLFGDDTKNLKHGALPAVWEKKADFMAKFDKLAADAKAAATASKDLASFKVEHKKVVSNCGGCHKAYRKPSK